MIILKRIQKRFNKEEEGVLSKRFLHWDASKEYITI